MNKELRQVMINTLEELAQDSTLVVTTRETDPQVVRHAALMLSKAGHLASFGGTLKGSRITLSGFNYLEELKHPGRTWLKRNWFSATVAGATLLLALVSSIAQSVAAVR